MAHDMPFDHDHITTDEESYWEEVYEPDQSTPYTCRKCGTPLTAAEADDNGGYCDECGSLP